MANHLEANHDLFMASERTQVLLKTLIPFGRTAGIIAKPRKANRLSQISRLNIKVQALVICHGQKAGIHLDTWIHDIGKIQSAT